MILRRYLANLAVWLDEGANVVLFGGNAHETISERAAVARRDGKRWGCALCAVLDRIVRGHCDRTWREVTTPQIVDDGHGMPRP